MAPTRCKQWSRILHVHDPPRSPQLFNPLADCTILRAKAWEAGWSRTDPEPWEIVRVVRSNKQHKQNTFNFSYSNERGLHEYIQCGTKYGVEQNHSEESALSKEPIKPDISWLWLWWWSQYVGCWGSNQSYRKQWHLLQRALDWCPHNKNPAVRKQVCRQARGEGGGTAVDIVRQAPLPTDHCDTLQWCPVQKGQFWMTPFR